MHIMQWIAMPLNHNYVYLYIDWWSQYNILIGDTLASYVIYVNMIWSICVTTWNMDANMNVNHKCGNEIKLQFVDNYKITYVIKFWWLYYCCILWCIATEYGNNSLLWHHCKAVKNILLYSAEAGSHDGRATIKLSVHHKVLKDHMHFYLILKFH